jgi:hypothetical protein
MMGGYMAKKGIKKNNGEKGGFGARIHRNTINQ